MREDGVESRGGGIVAVVYLFMTLIFASSEHTDPALLA